MPIANFSLENKVALITGAGGGIGRCLSIGLAEAGADVVLTGRNEDKLKAVEKDCKTTGRQALSIKADISQKAEIDKLVDEALAQFKKIDILVNNAARSIMVPMIGMREDGWDKILNTNLKGPFLLCQAVAKPMTSQGGGNIINITTAGDQKTIPGLGPYCVSKAGLHMLTKVLAVEWAPYKINVNAVGPGLVQTEFSRPLWDSKDYASYITARIPQGRVAKPEEVVGAVIFLASDASSHITGQTLYVDGGYLA